MNPILGANELHWASQLLGTQYREFHSPMGIEGLAKETDNGNHLHLLAIHAMQQGQGKFRAFIAEAKNQYHQISVWEIWNPIVENALNRYGFSQTEHTQDGETLRGMTWQKNEPQSGP